jgi:hypothetical protein
MLALHPDQKLKSHVSRQKIGKPNGYGRAIFGWSRYGEKNLYAGLYRVRHFFGKLYQEKMFFYPYVITNTAPQSARRSTFADAVAAWQALTTPDKNIYRRRAVGRHMFGYQLFLREYMLTH